MVNFLDKYSCRDKSFQLSETLADKKNQNVNESKFTLGNGFIGSRGIYEENPYGAIPGTYIPGIFDQSGAQVEERVNLPNPVHFIIAAEGEKFDIFAMKTLSHRRILDMKKGALIRRTLFKDARGREFIYQSIRFFSMDNPHIGVMRVSLKLIKGSASLTAVDDIDDSVYNAGGLMMAKKRHFNTVKADKKGNLNYISFKTNSYGHLISFGDSLKIKKGQQEKILKERIYDFKLNGGEEITFTKIFCIKTSLDYSSKSLKRETFRDLNSALDEGFNPLFKDHSRAFEKKWEAADVLIKGDSHSQAALRFNIYHMLISASEKYGRYSIGAKTLSGEGYRGHIFWDTEIYLIPFYIFTEPAVARELLLLRYNTLAEAKKIAKSRGFRGAMFPWESTVKGSEETPRYAKGLDGSIAQVFTQDYEHHITADIAFGVSYYCQVTGDRDFMLRYGAEIILQTARFWASRVEKKGRNYHIKGVIGPDEFHVNVDDNAFTNYMASWNLKRAWELCMELKDEALFKKLKKKLKIRKNEPEKWKFISSRIVLLKSKKYGIIKQFSGYLRKKEVKVESYDRYFMPEAPKYTEEVGLEPTRFIKQADVVLLFCLFPDDFSDSVKKKNYDFYINRTLHKSSLSFSAHAIVGSQVGDRFRAFNCFWAAANIDIMNVAGNTRDGIHAANLGGVWQSLVKGFGGLKISSEGLSIYPRLPGNFNKIKFKFYYLSDRYETEISHKFLKLKVIPQNSTDRKRRELKVFGKKEKITPFRKKTFKAAEEKKMITAKEIMKKENMVTVSENMPVVQIGRIILEKKASSAPVVDKDKRLKGIISEINIIESTGKDNFSDLKAVDIMKKNVVTVDINDPLEEITKTFTKYPYRRLPVLDGEEVKGVITRRDIIADFLGGFY